jgi:threonine/homoserine/homoserine lactone efflux protein
MLTYLLAAVSLGLSAGFTPGPLLATIIAQTMRHGLREGVKTACAPLLSDAPIIAAALWLLAGLAAYRQILGLVAVAGGLFVARLAWENWRARPPGGQPDATAANSLLKGIAVNLLSPHPYLFWLTVGGPLLMNAYNRHGPAAVALFLAVFYACLVGAMMFLALVAGRSRRALTGRGYVIVMRVLAVLLLILSFLLLREGWRLLA